ncbi:ATP-binding protein [Isoptericola croceus]|uniref:ATP-binding protein n=1 Tax=Isoptericola croceus TaxID=3031406 RepID=UPI0023F79DE9|nr:AAA family ATPase [Isoptericola croceus]
MFPFAAVIGQDELKNCLVLSAVDPRISGVLALGDRGTAKTTTVRALGALLADHGIDMPVTELPLGASEDRVLGTLDVGRAMAGEVAFAPGILSQAHGGFLYIDEVNLLDDFLVDVLLDVAASGVNRVERDGLSHVHEARFVLVGSGNPEEGELRPQLEDRFGLATQVRTLTDPRVRSEIVRRRLEHDADPEVFAGRWSQAQERLAQRIVEGRERLDAVGLPDDVLQLLVDVCVECGAVGHRADLVLARTARALAAVSGRDEVTRADVVTAAVPALQHRTGRDPNAAAALRSGDARASGGTPAAQVKLAARRVLGLQAA